MKKENKFLYDLSAIGILYYWRESIILTKTGRYLSQLVSTDKLNFEFANLALKTYKIQKSVELIKDNDIDNIKSFRIIADRLVENINSPIYKRQTLGKIYNWANFVIKYTNK